MQVIQFVIKKFTSQKHKMSVPSLDKTEIYLQNSASHVEVWDTLFILYVDHRTANFVRGALRLAGCAQRCRQFVVTVLVHLHD